MIIGVGNGQFYVDAWDGDRSSPSGRRHLATPGHPPRRLPHSDGLFVGGVVETLEMIFNGVKS